jgi:putative membrane protein
MKTPAWRQSGEEPDYRFTLANERTFLAWVRTALALLAGGVLLEQFATHLQPHALIVALALGLAILSSVLCTVAYVRWRANEIAMRHRQALPTSIAIPMLSAIAAVAAGVIAVVELLA